MCRHIVNWLTTSLDAAYHAGILFMASKSSPFAFVWVLKQLLWFLGLQMGTFYWLQSSIWWLVVFCCCCFFLNRVLFPISSTPDEMCASCCEWLCKIVACMYSLATSIHFCLTAVPISTRFLRLRNLSWCGFYKIYDLQTATGVNLSTYISHVFCAFDESARSTRLTLPLSLIYGFIMFIFSFLAFQNSSLVFEMNGGVSQSYLFLLGCAVGKLKMVAGTMLCSRFAAWANKWRVFSHSNMHALFHHKESTTATLGPIKQSMFSFSVMSCRHWFRIVRAFILGFVKNSSL